MLPCCIIECTRRFRYEINFAQIFLLFYFLVNLDKYVVLYHLIYGLWVDPIVEAFLADNEGGCGPIDMFLVLAKSVETEDDVLSFKFGYRARKILVRVPIVMLKGKILLWMELLEGWEVLGLP